MNKEDVATTSTLAAWTDRTWFTLRRLAEHWRERAVHLAWVVRHKYELSQFQRSRRELLEELGMKFHAHLRDGHIERSELEAICARVDQVNDRIKATRKIIEGLAQPTQAQHVDPEATLASLQEHP